MWSRGTSPCHFLRYLHIFSSGLTTFTLPEWTQNWLCRLASHEENRFCYFLKYFFHGHPALGRGSCFLELFGGLASCFCSPWDGTLTYAEKQVPFHYAMSPMLWGCLLACLLIFWGRVPLSCRGYIWIHKLPASASNIKSLYCQTELNSQCFYAQIFLGLL